MTLIDCLKRARWGLCVALLAGPWALAESAQTRTVEWTDLLPDRDLQAILNAPEVTHDGEEEFYSAPLQGLSLDDFEMAEEAELDEATKAFQAALVSTEVRPEFDGASIRIAGYMVPIEMAGHKNVVEFFLVPYFGACIHMPPPPPNQIIHIKHPDGYFLDNLFDPVWIEGQVQATSLNKSGVQAVYSMSAVVISPYQELPEFDD